MHKLEYSQIVRRKMKILHADLVWEYGEEKAAAIISKVMKGVRRLEIFPDVGTRVSALYDVKCDYSYVFVEHNYFFYRMKDEGAVLVLDMFNEKEDFMRQLFGIVTTPQETIDYWRE